MQNTTFNVTDGSDFSAEEISISHSPIRFVFDFKSVTPRVDQGGQPPRMVISHNVIKIDPFIAKNFLHVLNENIKKYESHYGEIKRPEALQEADKHAHKKGKKEAKLDYLG